MMSLILFVCMGFMPNHFSDGDTLDPSFVRVDFVPDYKPFFW